MEIPKVRTSEIVVQDLGQELLIYDLRQHKAYTLNETSKNVFQACDGATSFDELKNRYRYTDDIIFFALDGLQKQNLLEDGVEYVSPFAKMNRREVIRKVGLTSMIALPVISSLVAPQVADAQSACLGLTQRNCIPDNYRQSNCCPGLRCSPIANPTFCFPCGGQGQFFVTCANAGGCQNCDSAVEKNGCCSSNPATNDGRFCYCNQ